MRINSFFTTTVIDNGPIEALANRVLFAPLHYLLNDGSVHQVEVDLSRDRVIEIVQAPRPGRYLLTGVLLCTLAFYLVLPATLLGAIIKGLAQLHPIIAAKNRRASQWHPPTQREIFNEALASAPRDKSFLDPVANEVTRLSVLPFLTAADLSRVSQVSKTWCRFASDDAVWQKISKSCFYFLRPGPTYRETFKKNYLFIKQDYDSDVMDLFGTIDKILRLPRHQLSAINYTRPHSRPGDADFGKVDWGQISLLEFGKDPIVKGITRANRHFLAIRFVETEHAPSPYFFSNKKEGLILLFQASNGEWKNYSEFFPSLKDINNFYLRYVRPAYWLQGLVMGKTFEWLPAEELQKDHVTYSLASAASLPRPTLTSKDQEWEYIQKRYPNVMTRRRSLNLVENLTPQETNRTKEWILKEIAEIFIDQSGLNESEFFSGMYYDKNVKAEIAIKYTHMINNSINRLRRSEIEDLLAKHLSHSGKSIRIFSLEYAGIKKALSENTTEKIESVLESISIRAKLPVHIYK